MNLNEIPQSRIDRFHHLQAALSTADAQVDKLNAANERRLAAMVNIVDNLVDDAEEFGGVAKMLAGKTALVDRLAHRRPTVLELT